MDLVRAILSVCTNKWIAHFPRISKTFHLQVTCWIHANTSVHIIPPINYLTATGLSGKQEQLTARSSQNGIKLGYRWKTKRTNIQKRLIWCGRFAYWSKIKCATNIFATISACGSGWCENTNTSEWMKPHSLVADIIDSAVDPPSFRSTAIEWHLKVIEF